MTNLNNASTQYEMEAFRAKAEADWEKISRYYKIPNRPAHLVNPQYQLAPEYFQIYRDHRPSELAAKALDHAFTMWGNLTGISEEVHRALTDIPYDEDITAPAGLPNPAGFRRGFGNPRRANWAVYFLENLSDFKFHQQPQERRIP